MIILQSFLLFTTMQYVNSIDFIYRDDMKNGYCPIPKIQNSIELVTDNEECQNIKNIYVPDENYKFITYFGNMFDVLQKGSDSLIIPDRKNKMDTIFFVGTTGTGKSTLVQVISGDNSKIFSKSIIEGSDEFIIVDNSKIGTDTISSETLYPDLLVDNETQYVLCDNPGFRDTRSSLHEIVAMHSMRKVLKNTNRIKIVIVTTHSSLKIGMYRDEFPQLLKNLVEFIHDIDNYKKSFYIIANKVENTYKSVHGKPVMIPDSSIIRDIAYYLTEVKRNMIEKMNFCDKFEDKEQFYNNSVKIIDSIIEKDNNGTFLKVKLFRRPEDEGPISDLPILQMERDYIRKLILTDENFVNVRYNDFGITLSDTSLMFLNDLYKKMNFCMDDFSNIISNYLIFYYDKHITENNNIISGIQNFINFKQDIKLLLNEIGNTKNPGEYINTMKSFSNKNKLKLNCISSFKNISRLSNFLENLDDLINNTIKYTPLRWNTSMKIIYDHIEKRINEYKFFEDVFKLLSSYKIQKNLNLYNVQDIANWEVNNKEQGLVIDQNNFFKFIEKCNFDVQHDVHPDVTTVKLLNAVINGTLKHNYTVICKDNIVTIYNAFIVVSEIEDKIYELCNNAEIIEIFSLHTIFIDKDLDNKWFSGKDLVIIAPKWNVIGSRKICLDGKNGGETLQKAGTGQIGINGNSGWPGGKFSGVGMNFNEGENLLITANGGDGQNGQDGGDGLNGYNGINGNDDNHDGQIGGVGGDSGEGGKGGMGGKGGLINIYNLGNESHGISIVANGGKQGFNGNNGIPGIGGKKGCDLVIVEKKIRIFGIVLKIFKQKQYVNCNSYSSPNGEILRSDKQVIPHNKIYRQMPICKYITDLKNYFLENFYSTVSDGVTTEFINLMISTAY